MRGTKRGRSRLPARSPIWDSIPGPWAKGRCSTPEPPRWRLLSSIVQVDSNNIHSFVPGFLNATLFMRLFMLLRVAIVFHFHCCVEFYSVTRPHLSTQPLRDIMVASVFWLLRIVLLWIFSYMPAYLRHLIELQCLGLHLRKFQFCDNENGWGVGHASVQLS